MRRHDVEIVRAVERHPPGERLEEQDADRIDVRPGVQRANSNYLFGGHVPRLAQHGARLGQVHVGGGFREAESAQLDFPARRDQYVFRRDSAMHDSQGMRILQPGEHVADDQDGLILRQWTQPEKFRQGGAVDELRRHDQLSVEHQRVVKRDDVRMRQARLNLDLPEKPLHGLRIAIRGARQRPEDFELVRDQVAHLVRHPGFGLVDDTEELIITNNLRGLRHCLDTNCTVILVGGSRSGQPALLEPMVLN